MALLARFEPKNMTADKYAEVLRRLETQGLGAPSGRIHHTSYGAPERLHVVDLWDTPENFEAFGKVLMPILGALEIEVGAPIVAPVHNIIR
jgi:hypothetical protein